MDFRKEIVLAALILLVIAFAGCMVVEPKTQEAKNSVESSVSSAETSIENASKTLAATRQENMAVVEISGFAYNPKEVSVKKGSKVKWTNKDSTNHDTAADDGKFDTGSLAKDESKEIVFNEIGVFPYHCTIHPNMKGTVTVTE